MKERPADCESEAAKKEKRKKKHTKGSLWHKSERDVGEKRKLCWFCALKWLLGGFLNVTKEPFTSVINWASSCFYMCMCVFFTTAYPSSLFFLCSIDYDSCQNRITIFNFFTAKKKTGRRKKTNKFGSSSGISSVAWLCSSFYNPPCWDNAQLNTFCLFKKKKKNKSN